MPLALAFLSIFVWIAFVAYIIGKNIMARIDRLEKEIMQKLVFMEKNFSKKID